LENARHDLADLGNAIQYDVDPYEAARGAHAVAVLTDWDLYRSLDFKRIHAGMLLPAFVFDGRNCLDHDALVQIGFNVCGIGKVGRGLG
jgi:UDPglucose 6-dehydrogenase